MRTRRRRLIPANLLHIADFWMSRTLYDCNDRYIGGWGSLVRRLAWFFVATWSTGNVALNAYGSSSWVAGFSFWKLCTLSCLTVNCTAPRRSVYGFAATNFLHYRYSLTYFIDSSMLLCWAHHGETKSNMMLRTTCHASSVVGTEHCTCFGTSPNSNCFSMGCAVLFSVITSE